MHLTWLLATGLGIKAVDAFRNTSPFFFFSTEPISALPQDIPSIQSASALTQDVTKTLFECPSDTYIIATQPSVNAEDFAARLSAPHLRRYMNRENDAVKTSYSIRDVLGEFDADEVQNMLEKRCRARTMSVDASTGSFAVIDDMKPRVIRVEFPDLPVSSNERASKLAENDVFLSSIIDILPSPKYSVIYTTTPPSADTKPASHHINSYEMEESFPSGFHTDLKRDFSVRERSDGDNTTLVDGPLFERYQFFTPGLFMGLVVLSILLSILYVGVNGVASLQVSYAAFDKDMGPAAQKKQQ
ncbi:MAG: hypothetical protein M1812_004663 [Candelaria pacifica]|nr:MAG: hypothetical protein M1812_004663 [Candelaria pacifica]